MASSLQSAINSLATYFPATESQTRYSEIYENNCHRIYSLAFWMTDKGLAIYFAILPPSEDLHEYHDGPKPEDYDTEDKLITVTFAEAIRICWLDQCLFMLQSRRDSTIIWDAQRLWQHFEAIMQMRRGWAPIHANELRLHQNAVELSLVNACIAFRRLATGKDFKTSNGSGTELLRI